MPECEALTGGHSFGLPDYPAADAASPSLWINEETLKLGRAIILRQDDREADNLAVALGNVDTLLPDLFRGRLDGLRMGEQEFAVLIPGKRRTALQRHQFAAFSVLGRTDDYCGRYVVTLLRRYEISLCG